MSRAGGVIVLGGAGQVGQALVRQAPRDVMVRALGRDRVDLTDASAVDGALQEYAPELVINTAVFHPVDLCESQASRAFAVNAIGAGLVATACRRRGARMIHLSTDYVFSGPQRTPFAETDCPAPVNAYARSKLAGEHVVLAADSMHCVVRTSSVYGRSLPGSGAPPFVERMLRRALNGEPTRVVADQVVSPTRADDLARALWQLAAGAPSGLFHLAGGTPASWYEVADTVFRYAGRSELLSRTTAAEFGAPAPRAPYTALRSVRLTDAGVDPLPGFERALPRHLKATYPDAAPGENKKRPAAGD